jgi:maleate isomerase
MAAFSALGVRKLVFLSESTQPDHDKKLRYLREAGFDLLADKAVSLSGTDEYCIAPPQLWYDEAVALRRDATDAYFLSCANIHSVDVIEDLERTLGRPVVTSNQAAIWCALRKAGIYDPVPGLGHLLRHDAVTTPGGQGAKVPVAARA